MARLTTTKTKAAAAKAAAAKDDKSTPKGIRDKEKDQRKGPPKDIVADEASVAAANASEDQTAEPSTMDESAEARDD